MNIWQVNKTGRGAREDYFAGPQDGSHAVGSYQVYFVFGPEYFLEGRQKGQRRRAGLSPTP